MTASEINGVIGFQNSIRSVHGHRFSESRAEEKDAD